MIFPIKIIASVRFNTSKRQSNTESIEVLQVTILNGSPQEKQY